MTAWGASPEEWAWAKRLAKADLLPVVSNPHAEISPRSKMKSMGKTPSQYNGQEQVSGFPDWTEWEATVQNIKAWSAQPDYGICIQTRRVRGLDIDVPDAALATKIEDAFLAALDLYDHLPCRERADTGKRLLPFVLEGELSKRSFVVKEWQEWDDEKGKDVTKRWIVEFLADGQQFIAIGTHPSGSRYEWRDGLPEKFPEVTAEAFEAAWDAITEEFALADSERRTARRDPTLLEDLDVADPVAEHLIESDWPTYSLEKGMLYLDCPWKDGHSSDNGETETAWLLAGTGKYRNGHFACRHAGCSARTENDFFKAVGYQAVKAEDFEDLTQEVDLAEAYAAAAPGASPKAKELKAVVARKKKLPLPGFNRDGQGRIETSLENLTRALAAPQACDCEVTYDDFRDELMIAHEPGQWRSMADADVVQLRITLEALGFKDRIGRELMRDALELHGAQHRIDSAQVWLTEVVPEWDGVARIHRFWPDYMQTKDTPYTRALGNYSWTAQAGRILDPGCQADMVPVLVSPEGYVKTSVVAAIAPAREFFSEFNLSQDDEKLARLMRGCLVGELAELRGISVRDGEAVKSWITRRVEKWTPKFKERATSMFRRMLFYGTTNDGEFLQPHMGKRRWLPVNILSLIDLARIEADRLQLWAEARDVWLYDGGVQWREVDHLAVAERGAFEEVDPWTHRVAAWLDDTNEIEGGVTPRASGSLRTEQVLTECCGLDPNRIKKADQMRVAQILSTLGMERGQRWIGRRNVKGWVDARGNDE